MSLDVKVTKYDPGYKTKQLETASTNRPATLVQRVRPQIHRSSECPVRQPPKRAFQIQNSQKLSELEQNVSSDVCLETEGLFIKQEPTAATISPQEHLKSGMIQDVAKEESILIQDVAKEESILRTLLLEDDVNEYCDKSVLESGHNEFEDDLHQIDKKSSLIVHSVEKLLPEKIEQCLLEEKETPIILEENPIFVDNKDWMDFSIWANDPHALKNKIEKLRREILYLDMMAAQKEKERLLILHFRKYKKEVMKKIFRERILPSQRMELNVQTRQKSEKKPISTSSTSSAVKYCPKQYDSKSAKDISRKETCLVRPMLHVESNNDVLQRDSSVECAIVKTSRNFIRDPTEEHLSTRLTRNSNGHTKVEGLSSTAGSSQPICSSRRGPSFNLESFSYSNLSTGHVPHLSSNSSSFTSVAHSKNEIMSFSPLSSISRVTPVSDFNKAIVTDVTTPKNSTSYTGAAPQRSQMTGLSHVSKQEYMPHFSCSTVPLIAPPIYHSVHRIPPPTYNPLPLTVNSPSWIPVEFPWLGVKPPIDYQTNNRRLKEAVESREDGKKRCAGGQKSPRHVAPELNHFSMDNAVYRDDQLI
ncbi:uncharacterized protein LOC106470404 [Limulus polyphemus]|uniref:Uncharacterized protein LOC106470404 n=1 Tax=Limulus polyphemus TaxID=6850 RepID=A0ABM1BPY9_LIMPO|nr:uncharacterized protein LOC106470404 [Limulus polyphemus]